MRWSWKITRIFGIDVHVHATFALLLGWVALTQTFLGGGVAAVTAALLFTLAVFSSVVLHELGHALTARRFGIPTRDITLLPFGGVARLERLPSSPRQELWIALAGPAVNVVLSAALFLVAGALGGPGVLSVLGGAFLERLAWVNVSLAAFNLLPAFPMDGGRVLRAGLASRLGSLRATRIAARIGRVMAVLLAVAGLAFQPMLLLIAAFVWLAAGREREAAERQALTNEWLPPGVRHPRSSAEGAEHGPPTAGPHGSMPVIVIGRGGWPVIVRR